MADVPKKRGRPSKGDDAKRHALGIRTTRELKALIEEAAAESGLSIAQEVERRLIESFAEEDRLGGRETAKLARTLAGNIHWIEQAQQGRWYESDECFKAVLVALPGVMNRCRRTPLADVVAAFQDPTAVNLGFQSLDVIDEGRLSDYRPEEHVGKHVPSDDEE